MESPHTLVHGHGRGDPAGPLGPRRRVARSPTGTAGGDGFAAGDLLLGRYRLRARLGAGGFGVVWRAHDELLHRDVALKRVPIGPDGDGERASREALAAARLSHPAIVALYEACVVEDACCLISELVEGDTLAHLIAEDGVDDAQLLEIGIALARALAHAHARGVIHRDIKPQNVLIPARPTKGSAPAKLTDFGGASLAGEDALTRTGDVLGTLAYMAPEQSEGEEVGEEADLYALALVLYEGFSGVNPVRGPTPAATARRIGSRLEPLRRSRRDLPRALADALDAALSPEPDERGTLEDLRAALEDALADLDAAPRRSPMIPGRHEPAAPQPSRRALLPRRPRHTPARAVEASLPALEPELPAVSPRARGFALPRSLWIAGALALAGWQAAAGRGGVALVLLAALAPVIAWPADPGSGRIGCGWLLAALAPALGLVGLAGAYPAAAGQPSRWRRRAVLGALGYWWLLLAAPLLARRLWIAGPASVPPRATWEGSVELAAVHVIAPLLTLPSLLGALLWAGAAVALPLLVRGRSAAFDLLAAAAWSAAVLLAAPALDAGLAAHGTDPAGRGAIAGATLGGLAAVAARAIRGPV